MILARRIAAITRDEPRLLRRSPREVQAALDDGRAVVHLDGGDLAAFLFFYPYGAWAEVGSAWVRDDLRGRGLFARLHAELLPLAWARGLRPFEFPGSDAAERALLRMGAGRVPLTTLPAGVLARFAADRLSPPKLASYVRAARVGVHRTSTRLYVFDGEAADPARERPIATKGAPTTMAITTSSAD